jgi:hypothetical protein
VYLLDVGDQYNHLVNEDNYKKQDGMLVVEIILTDLDSSFIKIPKEGTEFILLVPGYWLRGQIRWSKSCHRIDHHYSRLPNHLSRYSDIAAF